MAFFNFSITGICQYTPIYTQYMFNGLLINPAYAGSREALNISALFRKQWVGLDGGPSTENLTADGPIKNNKIALGLIFINDVIALSRQTGVDGIYAYKISFSKNRVLSLGLQVGFSKWNNQFSSVTTKDPNDPSFSSSALSYSTLNVGTGVHYSSDKFYIGLSSPRLKQIKISSKLDQDNVVTPSVFYLSAGYIIPLSTHFKLRPSTLIKVASHIPIQADLNCTLLYHNVLWFGLSYRTFTSLSFIAKAQVTNQLSIGYAYDSTTNALKSVTKAGHELMVSYNFTFFKSNVLTPRDF